MTLVLYEDFNNSHLFPLTHLHPDFGLRCGVFTNFERLQRFFPETLVSLSVRPGLRHLIVERYGVETNPLSVIPSLFLCGRVLLTKEIVKTFEIQSNENTTFRSGGNVIGYFAKTVEFANVVYDFISGKISKVNSTSQEVEIECQVITYPWDLIAHNTEMLERDAALFPLGIVCASSPSADSTSLINPERMYIGERVSLGAGSILDASSGPVIIDDDAVIMHQAVIAGPAYIGKESRIKIGAKIYGGTSIGPVCKIGGEVEATIFHSYANKQHDGFAGHSYFAPWTNLGADTNTSDLKNNYSEIRMTLEGNEYNTGRMFLGTVMADYSKTGINTMLNTGTCIGVGCNLFGAGLPPKDIPSFSWGGAAGLSEYDFSRFLNTAHATMRRRECECSKIEEAALRNAFEYTRGLRASFSS